MEPGRREPRLPQGDEQKFYAYNTNKLAVVAAGGGAPRVLTPSLDRSPSGQQWSPDGKSVLFLYEDDRAAVVARVPAAGGEVEKLGAGRRVFTDFSQGKDGGLAVTRRHRIGAERGVRARERVSCAGCRSRTTTG